MQAYDDISIGNVMALGMTEERRNMSLTHSSWLFVELLSAFF